MAAHVEGDSPAAAACVEKPARVRPVMFLRLLDEVDLAQGSFVDQLFEPDVFWGEAKLLGVSEHHAGPLAGGDHAVAFREVEGHGLLDDDVLARRRRLAGHLAMQVVGEPSTTRSTSLRSSRVR